MKRSSIPVVSAVKRTIRDSRLTMNRNFIMVWYTGAANIMAASLSLMKLNQPRELLNGKVAPRFFA